MVNVTASATVIKLSTPVKSSGPNNNQGPGNVSGTRQAVNLPATGGQNLPLQGNKQPQESQGFVELKKAISEINEFVQSVQRDLSFNMDEESGLTVIRVIDRGSGDLVRQIPSEEVLAIASQIRDVRENAAKANDAPPGLLFSEST